LLHWNNVSDFVLSKRPGVCHRDDYANLVKVYTFWNLHAADTGRSRTARWPPLLEVMAVKRRIEDPLASKWKPQEHCQLSPCRASWDTIVGNTNLIVHQLLECGATKYPC